MQSMYFLIPISLFFFVVGIFAVYYAVRTRQFDDLDNEAQRVILDDRQLRRQQLTERAAKPASQPASTAQSDLPTPSSTQQGAPHDE
ncbi:cytochrome oxidase maturation protein, cbb3-type [Moraxella atlantae]|uniref:Cytochrome oxidase maturation protein, cbb3-type n=1 Tax=Faucicola atlantae TaxID=34059 RepID=A0A1B8Q8H1_9GAMM|nr:cbb3-type cytochrome oxidase assembly protein CcoS [Moraxella atlantae]OBX72978.1 cytochrome oxidase maturation protein, cbb3-type [Moraxella atlantae]